MVMWQVGWVTRCYLLPESLPEADKFIKKIPEYRRPACGFILIVDTMTDLKASRLKGERVKLDSEEFFFVKASILNSQTTTVRVRTAWNKRLPNKSSDCEPRTTERSLDIACSIRHSAWPHHSWEHVYFAASLSAELRLVVLLSSVCASTWATAELCLYFVIWYISHTKNHLRTHCHLFEVCHLSYLSHYTIVAKLKCWKIIHKGLIWQYCERSELRLYVK